MARRTAAFYAAAIWSSPRWVARSSNVLGLSLPALRVAGGFVLLLAALPMVTQYSEAMRRKEAELEAVAAKSGNWVQVVAALHFPISIGGATVAAVISDSGKQPSFYRALATSGICF